MLSAVYGHFGPKTVRHYVFSTEIYYFFLPVPKCPKDTSGTLRHQCRSVSTLIFMKGPKCPTNNDVEGWHWTSRRTTDCWIFTSWFSCCTPSLSWLTSAWGCCRNVARRVYYRRTRTARLSKLHSRLHRLWNEYCAGRRVVAQLLNACARATKCI